MSSGSRSSTAVTGTATAETTPDDARSPFLTGYIATSLAKLDFEFGAFEWQRLCRKVLVEREGRSGCEMQECDLHWRYRSDGGISIRSAYRSKRDHKARGWTVQHCTSLGPGIPLTTSFPDGDTQIEFPKGSFGTLENNFTNIRYMVHDTESSKLLQTLLYANNIKEAAELLYDRPVLNITSNLNKPESRGKNLRLWRRNELHSGSHVDIVYILFYTNALPEQKGHWVEEPSNAFQMLTDAVDKKQSDRLTLVFRNGMSSSKWRTGHSSKLLHGISETISLDSDPTQSTLSPDAKATESSKRTFSGLKSLNRFGYSELEITFLDHVDRRDFLNIWRQTLDPQLQLKEETTRSHPNALYTGVIGTDNQPLLQPSVNRKEPVTDSAYQAGEPDFRSRTLLVKAPEANSLKQQPHGSSADTAAEGPNAQLGEEIETGHLLSSQQVQMSRKLKRQRRELERHEQLAARARAIVLERAVSGGIPPSTIRRAGADGNGYPGWERGGATSRPLIELLDEDLGLPKPAASNTKEDRLPSWDDD
jgi:hypothetical protein